MKSVILKKVVELSSTKVELAIVDDIKNLNSDGERIISLQEDSWKWGERAEAEYKEAMKTVSDAEGIARGAQRQAASLLQSYQKVLNKAEIAAKELGVNPKSINGYSEALKFNSELLENQNRTSGYQEAMKKLM